MLFLELLKTAVELVGGCCFTLTSARKFTTDRDELTAGGDAVLHQFVQALLESLALCLRLLLVLIRPRQLLVGEDQLLLGDLRADRGAREGLERVGGEDHAALC